MMQEKYNQEYVWGNRTLKQDVEGKTMDEKQRFAVGNK